MDLLPKLRDHSHYLALHPAEEPWAAAMRAICQRHGLPSTELSRRLDGGNVVYLAGARRVIKLFAPMWAREHAAEHAVLAKVAGLLPVATPEVTACSEIDGWPYLVLARVEGEPAAERWGSLEPGDQLRVATELGRVASSLRELPTDGLESLAVDARLFLAARRAAFARDHVRRGAPLELVDDCERWMHRMGEIDAGRSVLLHADLADVNVMLAPTPAGWHIAGVIDFGDAFVGPADYELVTPGEFMFCGRPELVRAFLCAYGYAEAALDEPLAARLAALTVLHRFANVGRLATRVAARAGIPAADLSFERLVEIAWNARG